MKYGIVDLSGIFYTHWHATEHAPLGEARSRTVRDVRRIAEGNEVTLLALDAPGKTFRHELSQDYKAQRETRPLALYEQLREVEESLGREFHTFKAKGYEADDVIATLVAWLLDAVPECSVEVHSSDKDLVALVCDQVTVVSHKTGVVYDESGVVAKFGVKPSHIALYLALVGDASDNVKGVQGVGSKRAATIIGEWSNYEAIRAAVIGNATRVREVCGPAVAGHLHEAIASGALENAMGLTTLRYDAPIDCERALTKKEIVFMEEPMQPPPSESGDEEDALDKNEPRAAQVDSPPSPASSEGERDDEIRPQRPQAKRGAMTVAAKPTADVPWNMALEPRTINQALWVAEHVAKSGLFRKKFSSQSEALVAIMAGRERGMGVFQSLDAIQIVEGAPRWGAHAIVGLVLSSPVCEYFRLVYSDERSATYETKRVGSNSLRMSYTIEQAERAGLTRPGRNGGPSNYVRIPAEMLRKQAGVVLARAVYQDVVHGMYTPEEFGEDEYVVEAEVA